MSSLPADDPATPPQKPLPLPPVEAPNAGFLVQLFLAPLLIVIVIVMVWLLFSWLAHMGTNPQDLVRDIAKMNDASWQRAYNLAELLRKPQYESLKSDPKLAKDLGNTLDTVRAARPLRKRDASTETDEQRKKNLDAVFENRIKLEIFLCHVLGEFRVPDGLPALIRAASPDDSGDPQGFAVRSAALQAIAVQASQVKPESLQQNEELMQTVIATSKERGEGEFGSEEFAKLRSAAAFALGMIGGEEGLERLSQMLDDPDANTRFNAANGLARQGDRRALPILQDMLDPNNTDSLGDPDAPTAEITAAGQDWKRALVMTNAIRAARQLVQKQPTGDYSTLIDSLTRLQTANVNDKVKLDAKELKLQLVREKSAE